MLTRLRPFIPAILILEILIIAILLTNQPETPILGEASINPIPLDTINFPTDSELEYFYEPSPNSLDEGNSLSPHQQGITYTINSDALNERYDYPVEKSQNTYRIITLGDSFTFGLYVPTPANWTEQLEDQLNTNPPCPDTYSKYEVINLGMQGYDLQYSLERFRLRGVKYRPDLVIWLIKENDLNQVNEIIHRLEGYFRQEMQQAGKYAQEAKDDPYPSYSKASKIARSLYAPEEYLNFHRTLLNNFFSNLNSPAIIISPPNMGETSNEFLIDITSHHSNVTYFPSLPDIYSNPSWFINSDSHPSKEGHHQIAISILNHLQSTYLACP